MFFDEKKVKCFNKATLKVKFSGTTEWLYVCQLHDVHNICGNRLPLENNEIIRCESWINPDTHRVISAI